MENLTMFSMTTNESDDLPAATLDLAGVLDRHSYLSLIKMVRELYKRGHRNLIIGMNDVQLIGLTGFLALYDAAMVFNGERPIDPADGLKALHNMADTVSDFQTHHLKLIGPEPVAKKLLCKSGLPIYDDLEAALRSFAHERSLA
jgi:hypothetical protein